MTTMRSGAGTIRSFVSLFGRLFPAFLALACLSGVLIAGQRVGWTVPKASALRGDGVLKKDDWCREHSVPESVCIECQPKLLPRNETSGWCKEFGVHECPYCNPAAVQTSSPVRVSPEDLARARSALTFAPRPPNGKTCRLHQRRIQLASDEAVARLGIGIEPVTTASVREWVDAPGEIGYDPTRVARLSPRVAGTVWRIEKRIGDRVAAGDIVALVDSVEVGKAKAEFQQALSQVDLRTRKLAQVKSLVGSTVTGQEVLEAESILEESRVRLLLAEQGLANLGLPFRTDQAAGLTPSELVARMQFIGLHEPLTESVRSQTGSSNLLPVRTPIEGVLVSGSASQGQAADPKRPLFVVADTSRVWLTLQVRQEDADRIKPQQPVQFSHLGHAGKSAWDIGTVVWVSPAADERTRTIPVRVDLRNSEDRHPDKTFGVARLFLREEKNAIVVPTEAVHWEGCCNVVFVADRGFDRPDGFKVFHVRKVRPGAKDVTPAGLPVTEVIAGVLPGERVAVANSGLLRSELLKNDLGAG